MATSSPAAEFDALERAIVDHFFVLSPTWAVGLGLHRYDGRLPIVRAEETDAWLDVAAPLERRLSDLDESTLPESRRIDRFLLRLLLEGSRFDLAEIHEYDRNPMIYLGQLSLTSYIARDYAPAAERAGSIATLLAAVPAYLEAAQHRLRPVIPTAFLTLSISMGQGLPAHFAEAEEFALTAGTGPGARVAEARSGAEMALAAFVRRLKEEYLPRGSTDFAIGPGAYQRLLFVREGLSTAFEEIDRAGRADLERNRARLEQISREEGLGIAELLERLYRDHPTAAELIPTARSVVESTRRLVRDQALVTIPTPDFCRVEETPAWGRALSTASMNPPGPFDIASSDGIYYVTPVDAAWTEQQQEEWLRSLNHTMLGNITIHEVYPGHYLQFLHFRQDPGSLTRKVYLSNSFCEGWAHYAEQLAIEQGFGAPSVLPEVAQIHDALLRDCRLLVSIGLHTRGMTVAEATALFETEAHFEHHPAEREAIRGTFNPEYFCYTLGKLAILQARSKHLQRRFGGSLRGFHDALLGFGAPPVGLLDRLFAPEGQPA